MFEYCCILFQEFGYVHLSAGDLLREERKSGSSVAEEIEGHIKNGTIVPVEITCGLLEKVSLLVVAQFSDSLHIVIELYLLRLSERICKSSLNIIKDSYYQFLV